MTGGQPNNVDLQRILRDTHTIAVVGVSDKPMRPSYGVYTYLALTGDYEVFPVNPMIAEINGQTVYPSLADLPVVPDMVDVFRRHDELPAVLAETLALHPRPKTLWLQQGLWHDQVARAATAAGLQVVMDRCLKIDHARLF